MKSDEITYEEALKIAKSLSTDGILKVLDTYEDCDIIRDLKRHPWLVRPAFIAHKIYGDQLQKTVLAGIQLLKRGEEE